MLALGLRLRLPLPFSRLQTFKEQAHKRHTATLYHTQMGMQQQIFEAGSSRFSVEFLGVAALQGQCDNSQAIYRRKDRDLYGPVPKARLIPSLVLLGESVRPPLLRGLPPNDDFPAINRRVSRCPWRDKTLRPTASKQSQPRSIPPKTGKNRRLASLFNVRTAVLPGPPDKKLNHPPTPAYSSSTLRSKPIST
jgi:hypothetical protein